MGQCARYGGRRWPLGSPEGCWPAPRGVTEERRRGCCLCVGKMHDVDAPAFEARPRGACAGAKPTDRQGSERPTSSAAERPRRKVGADPWVATGVTERTDADGRARASKPRRTPASNPARERVLKGLQG